MNEFAGYTKSVPGGHWGMLRFARDGHPKPIMGEGRKPHVFPTEVEALRAVNRHLLAYFNGHLVRDGETLQPRSGADALFSNLKPFVRQRGKERLTVVERVGA
jgi:hypothetical protein